jgi:uncharacterized protein (TIGR00369 family)
MVDDNTGRYHAMSDTTPRIQQQMAGFFGSLLGIRLTETLPDLVKAEIDVRDDLCTVPGIMHGGAMMAFADQLGAVGTSLNLAPGSGTTTIESKTNFFAPGVAGNTVYAECTPLHRGKRTMVWQTRVTDENGRLLSLTIQTQMVLP